MKAFGLVIGTALALAGCARVWDKPGGTAAILRRR